MITALINNRAVNLIGLLDNRAVDLIEKNLAFRPETSL